MTPREPIFEALLLAAGGARRFGSAKLLAPYRDGTVLSAALATALASPARSVRVVVGCESEAVSREAQRTAEALGQGARLRITVADGWAEGMAASLRAGIGALPPDADAVFVFLGDMPAVLPGLAERLAESFRAGSLAAAPTRGGRRGNPVLIGRALFPDLMALTGDQGARRVLDRLGPALALIEVGDNGVLQDVDTPQDLARLGRL